MRDLNSVEQRLQRIEDKLDSHLARAQDSALRSTERMTKLEEQVNGMRGNLTIMMSAITAVVSIVVSGLVHYLTGRQ